MPLYAPVYIMNDSESTGPDSTDDGTPPQTSGDGAIADGGVAKDGGSVAYLEAEVNIFDPSTPFMRDHLRIIWTGFVAWVLIVFGPVTLTAVVPDLMTTQLPVIGFPLHYLLVAIGAPGGALVLAMWYARARDKLDQKYGITHETVDAESDVAAADGGEPE